MFEFVDVTYRDILDVPELTISEGVTAVVGPTGCGKTTLLKLLNKLISPTSGHVRYRGADLAQIPSVEHRRQVTMLTQSPAMFEGSVQDNLVAGLTFQGRPVPPAADLRHALAQVRLTKELDDPAATLSGGEKQRLALARVILTDPDVFLLDEPSSALDEVTERTVIDMVTDHSRARNKSIVMVTHAKVVAQDYADEIIDMDHGTVVDRWKP